MANEKRLMGIKTSYSEIEKKTLEQILQDIKSFQNLVEVVRCKDCERWERITAGNLCGRCYGYRPGLKEEYATEDDFCSYGERRTDNGV